MWILEPTTLFKVPFLNQLFGIGMRMDYTWAVHAILYGLLFYLLSFLFTVLFWRKGGILNNLDETWRRGLFGAIFANFATEVTQGLIHHYDSRNYFSIGDFVISLASAILIYGIIKRIPFKRIFSRRKTSN